tara:strand:+ start:687 stop:1097 length:411 start_codon:yes stop_codon:yes gene_type:complete
MEAMGQHTITIDCDVMQADGGTRTASITGASVALELATKWMVSEGLIERSPIRELVAAVSVGIVGGFPCLDLDYREDSRAQVDMNLVGTESGALVEIQGTAEEAPFSRAQLDQMIDLGMAGIETLLAAQARALNGG